MAQKLLKVLFAVSLVVPLQVLASKKCKTFCNLIVNRCLRVRGNLTVDGSVAIGGTLLVNGVNFNTLVGVAGAIGATGEQGIQGLVGAIGAAGATGATGAPGTPGIPGVGGVLAYGMFYGLTAGTGNAGPTDYAATVPAKTAAGTGRVPFPRDGSLSAGISRIDASSFTLADIGTYAITFKVHTTEPGQLQLELNGADLAETVAVNMNPTAGGHPIIGDVIISTAVPNSVLAVINPTGNSPALTITPADGASTHANAQSITIERIA